MNIDSAVFPTSRDYPEEMFRVDTPKGCRVGCGRAYVKSNVIVRRFFIERIRVAFRLLPRRGYDAILDLGTGSGFYLPLLSKTGRQVHGVDLAPVLNLTHKMIRRKGLQNILLSKADVTRLPFKSECFDLLFCLSLIEHIQDQKRVLREFKRVLRKDGVLILGYPMQNRPQHFFEELNGYLQCAKFFLNLSPSRAKERVRESRQYPHNHVSDFSRTKQIAGSVFNLKECVTVKLLGFSVYEILLLTN